MIDIHLVSHTHWDREWYLTYEQFRFRLVTLIDRLLDLLDAEPEYKHFHLDGQTIVLEDYLEIRPEQEGRLRRAIETGRVLIGPWYVMPDEFLVSGESLVRNLARGHRIARRFGTPMPVGYLPDLFGHVAQMPQIWRRFGIDNTILWRGFGGRNAEYWWQAPDGSRILMMHLPPEGYCNATRVVLDSGAMMARAAKAIEYERGRTVTAQVLLMNGVDHVEPQAAIPELVRKLSTVPDQHARHSTLPDYVAAVRREVHTTEPHLETTVGELRGGEEYANLLPGVLSARLYLKQRNAHVQTLLESYAEPLAACASVLGARYPDGALAHAWTMLLQNHPHDSICGCSVDAVHEENMTRFARAGQVAESVIESSLAVIADSVAAAQGTIRTLAFNATMDPSARVVEAFLDLPYESAEPWRTVDPQALDRPVTFWPSSAQIASVTLVGGGAVPFQVLGEEDVVSHEMSRFETPWALRARRVHLLWWAPSLPPCGYAAFDVRLAGHGGLEEERSWQTDLSSVSPVSSVVESSILRRVAENEFVRVVVNDDGTLDLLHKETGREYHGVGMFEDTGDVGDEYNYCPPPADRRVTSTNAQVRHIGRVHDGPLRTTFRIDLGLQVPAGSAPDRRSRDTRMAALPVQVDVTIDAGSPRVTFAVSLDNAAQDHRLRMLFPTAADRVATARADTAFDVLTRPARRDVPTTVINEAPVSTAPMLSFVDAGSDRAGGTVIAKGLTEYELIEDTRAGQTAIALTLIRAVGDLSRNDLATRPSGHAGPPVATPAAQCPGRHTFHIAFEARGAAPAAGALCASARAFTVPPRVVVCRRPDGSEPATRSFLDVSARSGDIALSALKKTDDRDSLVVRMFNPGDMDADVFVTTDFPVRQAFEVNLLEEREHELVIESDGIRVRAQPHQILTIELLS